MQAVLYCPNILRVKEILMRIDMHVHYMPPSLAQDREFYAREPYWEFLANPSSSKSVQGWATAERMIEDMDRAGIDKVVLQGEYFLTHASAARRNVQVLEIMHRWPERVIGFAAIQPRAGELALQELQRCLDGGMQGVGEISPYAQNFTFDDANFHALVQACATRSIPLLVHANEEVGKHYRGKVPTPLSEYYRLASQYPELKLVLAHWGGGLYIYEMMPEVRKALRNVWYDTAASPLVFPGNTVFQTALQCLDHRKILYASDYPLLLYPRTQREPDFRPFLDEITALGLPPGIAQGILGDNAARLLGLLPETEQALAPGVAVQKPKEHAPGEGKVAEDMSVSWVAQAFPETRAVFDRYGLAWQDSPVPFWEPIIQAACARGMNAQARARLLAELNESLGAGRES